MQFLLLAFILVPIIEIGLFIQVGGLLGLAPTILIVIVTAIVGVNLLKQQGFKVWHEIQLKLTQGQVPAIEMAAAAQLLFAGALLLTPGFATDIIGFLLMVPQIRQYFAQQFLQRWSRKGAAVNINTNHHSQGEFHTNFGKQSEPTQTTSGRVVEGEFEDKSR